MSHKYTELYTCDICKFEFVRNYDIDSDEVEFSKWLRLDGKMDKKPLSILEDNEYHEPIFISFDVCPKCIPKTFEFFNRSDLNDI